MRYEPVTIIVKYPPWTEFDLVPAFIIHDNDALLTAAFLENDNLFITRVERVPGNESSVLEVGGIVHLTSGVRSNAEIFAIIDELFAMTGFAFVRDVLIERSSVGEVGWER